MKNLPSWLNRNLLGFGIASFFSDASHEIVPLVLPTLIGTLVGQQNAPQFLGLISGFSTAAASFTTILSGWISDHIKNRKPLILLGYGLATALVGVLGLAHSWVSVFILLSLAWVGRGIVRAPRDSLLADSVDPAHYGHAFGFRQALDTAGAVAGPTIVYFFSGEPPSTLFLFTLIPGSIALIALKFLVQEVPHRKLSFSFSFNFNSLPGSFYYFLAVFFIFGVGNFNRTLLLLRIQEVLQSSHSHASALSLITLLYIFRNVIQIIAAYSMGAVSDGIGRKLPLAVCGYGFFGLMSLALLYPSSNLAFLILIFFLSGFAAGTYSSVPKSVTADLLPEELRGTGFGLMQTTMSIAELIGSVMVGFLWSALTPEIGFLYAALMSFIAACMLFAKNS